MVTGIIIVDHGSRSVASNELLETTARRFAERFKERYSIVEPAHMEMAEPSIAQAFERCVQRGAQRVIVCPWFLAPGKHILEDIPRLAAEAAERYPGVEHLVAAPLGFDDRMLQVLEQRIGEAVHSAGVEQLERI